MFAVAGLESGDGMFVSSHLSVISAGVVVFVVLADLV